MQSLRTHTVTDFSKTLSLCLWLTQVLVTASLKVGYPGHFDAIALNYTEPATRWSVPWASSHQCLMPSVQTCHAEILLWKVGWPTHQIATVCLYHWGWQPSDGLDVMLPRTKKKAFWHYRPSGLFSFRLFWSNPEPVLAHTTLFLHMYDVSLGEVFLWKHLPLKNNILGSFFLSAVLQSITVHLCCCAAGVRTETFLTLLKSTVVLSGSPKQIRIWSAFLICNRLYLCSPHNKFT